MISTKLRLGFIGTMIDAKESNAYAPMGQIIAEHFLKEGYLVVIASRKANKIMRLLDIIKTLFVQRKNINILVIQVYSGMSFVIVDVASWLGKIFSLPMIFHVHGGSIPVFMEKYLMWTMHVFKRATLIVAPSRYLASSLEEHGFTVKLIPNMIDLPQYDFVHRHSVVPKIVWLRAFHKIYNPNLAVFSLLKLFELGIFAKLTMVGPNKEDGSLDDLLKIISEHKITEQIEITGCIPNYQVPELISQHDVFINTTNIDNTPISVIEAMACGLCVVSTNVGGIPYLLENGKDGLLVPPDNPEAMAFAIRRILTESGLAAKLSMNARKKAEQFGWSVVLPQWEEIFYEVLKSHG